MWRADDAHPLVGWPTVTIDPDGWYRVEIGGRVGVGPDAEAAIRDLEGQPPVCEAARTTEGEVVGRRRLG
jgi:hypothetical protein